MPNLRQGRDAPSRSCRSCVTISSMFENSSRSDNSPLSLLTSGALLQKLMIPMVRFSFPTPVDQPRHDCNMCTGTPTLPKAIWPIRSKNGPALGTRLVLTSGLGLFSQVEEMLVEQFPIVLVLLDQRLQLLAQLLVEHRVFVEMDLAVLANRMFHLAGLGLRRCVLLKLL